MGTLNDLGTSEVADICPITGYPRSKWGSLLNSISPRDGKPEKDWDKVGTKLYNFTNPYGHLHFACGSNDDFTCFDYVRIDAGPRGEFIILDSTWNSETSHYISGVDYHVLPCNSTEERVHALNVTVSMVDSAVDVLSDNEVRHTRKGWNQRPEYFLRCVAQSLFPWDFKKYSKKTHQREDLFSDREFRFGGKKIDALVEKLCTRQAL